MNATRGAVASLMCLVAGLAAAADDYKVIKLEQDVRKLEQQVRELSRQIAELRRGVATDPAPRTPHQEVTRESTSGSSPPWLQAKNWQRLRIGMSESEVIDTLGPPTSTRVAPEGDTRTLFYALEIDTASFLGGSVEMRDRRVVDIKVPMLK